jgi:hypothetical protein
LSSPEKKYDAKAATAANDSASPPHYEENTEVIYGEEKCNQMGIADTSYSD